MKRGNIFNEANLLNFQTEGISKLSSEDEIHDDAIEITGDEDLEISRTLGGSLRSCTKCNRPITGHPGYWGQDKCTNEPLTGDKLEEYIERLKKKMKKKREERQKVLAGNKSGPGTSNQIPITTGTNTVHSATPPIPSTAQAAGSPMDMKAFFEGFASLMQQNSQRMDIEQVTASAATAAAKAVAEANAQASGRSIPYAQTLHGPTPVPKFYKNMTVEAFCKRLKVWNQNQGNSSESLKMTMILDSLKENTEREELKNWVIFNIDDDESFDLTEAGIFNKFLARLKEKFDISSWEKSETVWRDLLAFKAKEDEKTKMFLERFQEIESRMKNIGNVVPDMFMAVHLLDRAEIPEHTRQSVLSNINLEDKRTVLKDVKKKMENLIPKVGRMEEKLTLWNDRQKGYEGPENKRGRFYRGENYPQQDLREGRRQGGRSKEREEQYWMQEAERESQQGRGRSKSRNRFENRGRSNSKGRSKSRGRDQTRDVFSSDSVEHMQDVYFTDEENKAVLDSGCPKTVGGKFWLDMYVQSLRQTRDFQNFYLDEEEQLERFRFGPSQVFTSTRAVFLPLKVGNEVKKVRMLVVDANVPCLIGRDHMMKWKGKLDFAEKTLTLDDKYKVQLSVNNKGHYALAIS